MVSLIQTETVIAAAAAPNEKSYKATSRANDLFERHLYTDAMTEYTKVLQTSTAEPDYLALIYANRSATYLKLNQYQQAYTDAVQVIDLAPHWSKALLQLSQFDEAIGLLKTAIQKENKQENREQISRTLTKTLIEKDNDGMGIAILQLVCGKDIAIEKSMNPIQNKLYEFASHMKNIIHLLVDKQTKRCVIVDACWDIDSILKYVTERGYTIVASVVTHYHFDHVGGTPPSPYDTLPIKISGLASLLKKLPHIKAYVHPLDIPFIQQANPTIPSNRMVPTCTENITAELIIGQLHIRFIHTPGHTPGSQSLLINHSRLIAGDTLLCGGHCGRTDLPGGDRKSMQHTLRHVLGDLDNRIIVYPGHDYGVSWSTIGMERENGCLGDELVGFGMKN
ncbi:beta-lactamase-like protein [Mucor mucedo]|uniref:beta-lactamase-like protein n=1 Tax=Mucor mucedo TaxID=29922 RepID=UPI002220A976|nr:beta-lactamase-like protein [Mucor mucedo]KAI7888257.1 beta-lactamase-like protein [Mucor mucedo]